MCEAFVGYGSREGRTPSAKLLVTVTASSRQLQTALMRVLARTAKKCHRIRSGFWDSGFFLECARKTDFLPYLARIKSINSCPCRAVDFLKCMGQMDFCRFSAHSRLPRAAAERLPKRAAS